MFYPKEYCCKALATEGGAARCNVDAVGDSGFCAKHSCGDGELPPRRPLILFKTPVKEFKGKEGERDEMWVALTAAGVKVEVRPPNYDAALNKARVQAEMLHKGAACHDRVQRLGQPRQADSGIRVFGVGGHRGPLDVAGLVGELVTVGYSVVGYHILRTSYNPTKPQFVVALIFSGKPEEGCDWGKVAPIAEELWKNFSYGVNIFDNHPFLMEDPETKEERWRGDSYTVNLGPGNGPAKWILRWNDRSWGLEPVAKTVLAPAPAATQTINNQNTPSA